MLNGIWRMIDRLRCGRLGDFGRSHTPYKRGDSEDDDVAEETRGPFLGDGI